MPPGSTWFLSFFLAPSPLPRPPVFFLFFPFFFFFLKRVGKLVALIFGRFALLPRLGSARRSLFYRFSSGVAVSVYVRLLGSGSLAILVHSYVCIAASLSSCPFRGDWLPVVALPALGPFAWLRWSGTLCTIFSISFWHLSLLHSRDTFLNIQWLRVTSM